jgi:hypothetical protein
MLTTIPLLSLFIFGAAYPLCFLLSADAALKQKFHHFHIGLPNVVAGLAVLGLWYTHVSPFLQGIAVLWLCIFFVCTGFYWSRESVSPAAAALVSLAGLGIYTRVHSELVAPDIAGIAISILSGLIVAAAFYAMNLGHWYLNVHGLSLRHLKRAVAAFAVLLALRLLWGIIAFTSGHVEYRGDLMTYGQFAMTLDGVFLWIAILFGTVMPLGCMYFVHGTLALKNTQAATGILYVLLSAVLLGDLTYKYYLVAYHVFL